jgi:hypothetical protein
MTTNVGATAPSSTLDVATPERHFASPARMMFVLIAIVVGEVGNMWNILAGYNGQKITTDWLTKHPSAAAADTYGTALFAVGLVALLLAVCVLVRARGAAWATLSLVVGMIGTMFWTVSAAVPFAFAGLTKQTVISTGQANALADYLSKHDTIAGSGSFPGFLLLLIAQLAITMALIRSRSVPIWVPILFVVGAVIETAFASGGALTALCTVPQIVAMIAIGWYGYRKSLAQR